MGDVVQMIPSLYCGGCCESHRGWYEDVNQPDTYICKYCYTERPRIIEVDPTIEETEDGCELSWLCPRCGQSTGITFSGEDPEAMARHFQRQVEHGDYDPTCTLCSGD